MGNKCASGSSPSYRGGLAYDPRRGRSQRNQDWEVSPSESGQSTSKTRKKTLARGTHWSATEGAGPVRHTQKGREGMRSTRALARPLGQLGLREERELGWLGCQAENERGGKSFHFYFLEFIYFQIYFKSI